MVARAIDGDDEIKNHDVPNIFHDEIRICNFSFLALLVMKSYKKLKVQNSTEKFPHFSVKKCSKPFLSLELCLESICKS